MRVPILSRRSEYWLTIMVSSRILGACYCFNQLFSRPRRLLSERLQYLGGNHFFTAFLTNMSINYADRAVCPFLRESSRAEGRAQLFFSANIKPNYLNENFARTINRSEQNRQPHVQRAAFHLMCQTDSSEQLFPKTRTVRVVMHVFDQSTRTWSHNTKYGQRGGKI
jgi:hypothetical protein